MYPPVLKGVSLGDAGQQIKSSKIQTPSDPNLIGDYDTNLIPS